MKQEPEVRRQLAAIDRELNAFEPLAALPPDAARGRPKLEGAARARPPVHPLGNVDRFAPALVRFVRFTVLATNNIEPCLDELEVFTAESSPRNVALASAGAKATASGVFANGTTALHKLEHINDGRYGNGRSWISSESGGGWVEIQLPEAVQVDRIAWARDREGKFADRLATGYKIEVAHRARPVADRGHRRRPAQFPGGRRAGNHFARECAGGTGRGTAIVACRTRGSELTIARGRHSQSLRRHVREAGNDAPAAPRRPACKSAKRSRRARSQRWARPLNLAADAPEAERRLALARWIGDEHNPLTARVMVNRLWHYHFGQGLVSTPSDFGFHGGRPSHPRAARLAGDGVCRRRAGASKSIHRLIMLSATYRQSSRGDARAAAIDSGGKLFWRFAPRRLEAEPIRDSILAASGKLDLRMGGPGYDAFEPNTNYVHVYQPRADVWPGRVAADGLSDRSRACVQDATFGAFDCPDASQVTPRRNVSTTAIQALNLLNSPFVVAAGGVFRRAAVERGGRRRGESGPPRLLAGIRPRARRGRTGRGARRLIDATRVSRVLPRTVQRQRVCVCAVGGRQKIRRRNRLAARRSRARREQQQSTQQRPCPLTPHFRTPADDCSTGAVSCTSPRAD